MKDVPELQSSNIQNKPRPSTDQWILDEVKFRNRSWAACAVVIICLITGSILTASNRPSSLQILQECHVVNATTQSDASCVNLTEVQLWVAETQSLLCMRENVAPDSCLLSATSNRTALGCYPLLVADDASATWENTTVFTCWINNDAMVFSTPPLHDLTTPIQAWNSVSHIMGIFFVVLSTGLFMCVLVVLCAALMYQPISSSAGLGSRRCSSFWILMRVGVLVPYNKTESRELLPEFAIIDSHEKETPKPGDGQGDAVIMHRSKKADDADASVDLNDSDADDNDEEEESKDKSDEHKAPPLQSVESMEKIKPPTVNLPLPPLPPHVSQPTGPAVAVAASGVGQNPKRPIYRPVPNATARSGSAGNNQPPAPSQGVAVVPLAPPPGDMARG